MTTMRPRWAVRCAVVIGSSVCALLAASAASGRSCDGCAGNRPPVAASQSTSAEEQLAEKYVPIIYLRNQSGECDKRGSPYAPAPVEFLFGVDSIVLKQHESGQTIEEARGFKASDLYGKDRSYFIDLPGNPKRPGCGYERDYLARSGDYVPVAYAHIAREEGRDGFALQYWFFYYFNDWNNTHEGDWEMIQLNFDGPNPADALSQDPTGVGYSQHGGGERGSWDSSKLAREGNHPVAFVAVGANANQFEPNIILGRGDNGTGFGCDDASKPSRRVPLETRLMEDPTGPSSEYAWLAFDGLWGERAPWEFSGPTGPNDKRAWREPFSWQENLRPSSIIVPSRSTIGPNAVNFFCDTVWYVSTPLMLLVFHLPPIVFVIGAIGAVSGTAYLTTRTRYRPVTDQPLRQRRRFGQLLRAAGRLYRSHATLFIAIGIIFIPAAIVESVIVWLLFVPPYADTVAGYFSSSLAVKAVIALAIGNLTASLVYWFVIVSSLAALARIDAGRADSPGAGFRDVLRQLRALVVPRLKALAIVVGLAVTVVGIPWAIRQANRWAFIEASILLDRVAPGDSRAASAGAVDGHWWHTFFCLRALGIVGHLLGPAVAFLLLFLTPASVYAINIISSLVFVAVTPFVAIAQALLYFDLTTQDLPAEESTLAP